MVPRRAVDFNTVRDIGLALPDVEDNSSNGTLALKVHGKLMACTAISKSAEPNSLMVRVDFDDRAALITEEAAVYYVTDHYAPYNAVLVRLSRVKRDALQDLLRMAHKFVTRTSRKHTPKT